MSQFDVNGVPTFYFELNDGRTSFNTGFVSLTGTTAYNAPGGVGFGMNGNAGQMDNFSFAPTVPEPGTWAVCGVALAASGAWMQRRRSGEHPATR